MANAQQQATEATDRDTELAKIASAKLGMPTLQTRNSDSLDFREVAVWQVRAALLAAFELGRKAVR